MNRKDLKENWPLPNEYMVELGRISALYSVLENIVNISINKLAGYPGAFDYRSAIMLAHSNFQQRVDILETLFEQSVSEHPHLNGYEKVIKLIKQAQKGRNKFIHSSIGFNPDTKKVELSSMSARGTLKTTVETIYIAELKEVAAISHEAACALHSIITITQLKPLWERKT